MHGYVGTREIHTHIHIHIYANIYVCICTDGYIYIYVLASCRAVWGVVVFGCSLEGG